MKTRQQYLDGEVSHHDYYIQFATPEMYEQVKEKIGLERIEKSKDEHLNDISMKLWDSLSGCLFRGSKLITPPSPSRECYNLIKQAGEVGVSPAMMVCIYKAIARELVK